MDDYTAPLSSAEAAFLAALDQRGVRHLVVGMSAALMQGVRGSTEDIELWFASLAERPHRRGGTKCRRLPGDENATAAAGGAVR